MANLDMLSFLDVVWESYNADRVADCAPWGLPAIHTWDRGFFHMTTALVYDMVVELPCTDIVEAVRELQSFPSARAIRTSLTTRTSKYHHVNYMTYIILTYSLHYLHSFHVQPQRIVVWSLLDGMHDTVGCRLGSGRTCGVPSHGLAHKGISVTCAALDPDLHLGMTQDTFPHHRMEGIADLVS
jgi:hypothetical protein